MGLHTWFQPFFFQVFFERQLVQSDDPRFFNLFFLLFFSTTGFNVSTGPLGFNWVSWFSRRFSSSSYSSWFLRFPSHRFYELRLRFSFIAGRLVPTTWDGRGAWPRAGGWVMQRQMAVVEKCGRYEIFAASSSLFLSFSRGFPFPFRWSLSFCLFFFFCRFSLVA